VSIATDEGSTPGLHAGRNEGSQGTITVTGQDSTISITNNNEALTDSYVAIGRGGQGTLTVADGGTFQGALFMHVGRDATGSGTVNISGANSRLEMAGSAGPERDDAGQGAFLTVGRNGDGELSVENGGAIAISAEESGFYPGLALGFFEGSTGTMTVAGAGSSVTVSGGSGSGFGSGGIIHVGRQGDGELTVSDGGSITNSAQGVLTVGLYPTGNGSVTVTGQGATIDAGQQVLLGSFADFDTGDPLPNEGGTGQISVESGGRLEAGEAANDGVADIVIGANATLEVASGGTLVGDVRIVGGSFNLADGAIHQGEVIG
jgi:T5SS/PEP-CTERM-associated repeat protein